MIIIWGSAKKKLQRGINCFFIPSRIISFFNSLTFIVYWANTTYIIKFLQLQFSYEIEKYLFFLLFAGFAIKIPMFPTHIWLPKAHVEAPTVGSILLAGVLLKLGSYVYIRFLPFIFPAAFVMYRPYITVLAVIGLVYAAFVILRQIDFKRIIAYSSVNHMNLVTLGCLVGNMKTTLGAVLLTIGHGLASSGLFACVGIIYDRFKTRNILYLRALNNLMPILTTFFFLFTLANIGFPPSLNFISELLILLDLLNENSLLPFYVLLGVLLSAISSFWVFARVFAGNFNHTKYGNHLLHSSDVTSSEFFALLPLSFLVIILGVRPSWLAGLCIPII